MMQITIRPINLYRLSLWIICVASCCKMIFNIDSEKDLSGTSSVGCNTPTIIGVSIIRLRYTYDRGRIDNKITIYRYFALCDLRICFIKQFNNPWIIHWKIILMQCAYLVAFSKDISRSNDCTYQPDNKCHLKTDCHNGIPIITCNLSGNFIPDFQQNNPIGNRYDEKEFYAFQHIVDMLYATTSYCQRNQHEADSESNISSNRIQH